MASSDDPVPLVDRGEIYTPPPAFDPPPRVVNSEDFKYCAGKLYDSIKMENLLPLVFWTLSLPAQARHQHRFLQDAVTFISGSHRGEVEPDQWCRWLSWVDLRLVDAYPEVVPNPTADNEYLRRLSCCDYLIDFNRREGFIGDAIAAAQVGVPFGQFEDDLEDMRAQLAADGVEGA